MQFIHEDYNSIKSPQILMHFLRSHFQPLPASSFSNESILHRHTTKIGTNMIQMQQILVLNVCVQNPLHLLY